MVIVIDLDTGEIECGAVPSRRPAALRCPRRGEVDVTPAVVEPRLALREAQAEDYVIAALAVDCGDAGE